jgi:hypothetical protein
MGWLWVAPREPRLTRGEMLLRRSGHVASAGCDCCHSREAAPAYSLVPSPQEQPISSQAVAAAKRRRNVRVGFNLASAMRQQATLSCPNGATSVSPGLYSSHHAPRDEPQPRKRRRNIAALFQPAVASPDQKILPIPLGEGRGEGCKTTCLVPTGRHCHRRSTFDQITHPGTVGKRPLWRSA